MAHAMCSPLLDSKGARDVSVKVAALSVFEHNGQVCLCEEQVPEAHDVRMAEADVGLQLTRDMLVDASAPLQVLDGDLFSGLSVDRQIQPPNN